MKLLDYAGPSCRSPGHCCWRPIDFAGFPDVFLLVVAHVGQCPAGLWTGCICSPAARWWEGVSCLMFVCRRAVALWLLVLWAACHTVPEKVGSRWMGHPKVRSTSRLVRRRGGGASGGPGGRVWTRPCITCRSQPEWRAVYKPVVRVLFR